MDLSKLSKETLEDILCDLLEDVGKINHSLSQKYDDIIEDELYYIDEMEAMKIVRSFKPYGEVYSMADVKELLTKMQISADKVLKYYLCMNMSYNDYKSYPESKRLDVKEFCFEMSKLFINDIDAPKHKVAKYFKSFEEN
jgi:hypothetical protein